MNKPQKITNEDAYQLMLRMNFQERVITRLLLETGLRITDVLQMTLKNVKDGKIVEKKTKKTKHLHLNFVTQGVLENYIRDYYVTSLLFYSKRDPNKAIHRSTYYRALERVSRELGIRVSPHSFRHLYAQNIYARTHDIYSVQEAMQHKYIQTTAGYLEIDVEGLITAAVNPEEVQGTTLTAPRAGRKFLSLLAPALSGGRSAFAFCWRVLLLPPAMVARRAWLFCRRGLLRRPSSLVFRSARVVGRLRRGSKKDDDSII